MNGQGSGGSRSFTKGARASEMRSQVTGHQKVTMTNREQGWTLLQPHEKLPKNSTWTIRRSSSV